MSDDAIPYQQQPAVAQLRAELANALDLGQETRVEACRKQLAALGADEEAEPKKGAAEKRKAAAEDKPEAKTKPPEERAAPAEKKSTAKHSAPDKG